MSGGLGLLRPPRTLLWSERGNEPKIAVIVFLGAALGSGSTLGQTPPTVTKLPPVGLAAETAQVNLTNIGVFTCTGSVAFYDGTGAVTGAPANFTVACQYRSKIPQPWRSGGLQFQPAGSIA